MREALVDAVTAGARGDPRRWGRAMDDFNSSWRATTVCLSTLKGTVRDTCGNVPRPKEPCDWYALGDSGFFGLGALCRVEREWSIDLDLIEQFHPRADPGELACFPQGDDALDRLKRYLRRTAPRVARNLFFDADCDPQLIVASYRSAVVTALHAVARIAAAERAR